MTVVVSAQKAGLWTRMKFADPHQHAAQGAKSLPQPPARTAAARADVAGAEEDALNEDGAAEVALAAAAAAAALRAAVAAGAALRMGCALWACELKAELVGTVRCA